MDGSTKRTDLDFMKSLIAGLLSLGQLAERVVDRSFPVRFLVIWILSRSEHIAWRHIPDHVVSPFVVHHHYSRLHAQHLFWLFRTAAYWLKRELRQQERFAIKWAKWETCRVNEATEGRVQEPSRPYRPPTWGGAPAVPAGCGELVACLRHFFFAPAPRLDSS